MLEVRWVSLCEERPCLRAYWQNDRCSELQTSSLGSLVQSQSGVLQYRRLRSLGGEKILDLLLEFLDLAVLGRCSEDADLVEEIREGR